MKKEEESERKAVPIMQRRGEAGRRGYCTPLAASGGWQYELISRVAQ
jgi:hypothetical protein